MRRSRLVSAVKGLACLGALALIAASVVACGSSGAKSSNGTNGNAAEYQSMTLRLATDDPPTSPGGLGDQYLIQQISKRTKGKVRIKFYPSSELGTEQAMVTGVQTGLIDMVDLSTSEISGTFPQLGLFTVPFLIPSEAGASALFASSTAKNILAGTSKQGVHGLMYLSGGPFNILSKHPISTLAAMKGVKIRTTTSTISVDLIQKLGGNAVPMAADQTYSALQQGVVAGVNGTLAGFVGLKYDEQAKYLSDVNVQWDVEAVLISTRAWNEMNSATKAAVMAAAQATQAYNAANDQQLHQTLLAQLKQAGVQVIHGDSTQWANAAASTRSEFLNSVGKANIDAAFQIESKY